MRTILVILLLVMSFVFFIGAVSRVGHKPGRPQSEMIGSRIVLAVFSITTAVAALQLTGD